MENGILHLKRVCSFVSAKTEQAKTLNAVGPVGVRLLAEQLLLVPRGLGFEFSHQQSKQRTLFPRY